MLYMILLLVALTGFSMHQQASTPYGIVISVCVKFSTLNFFALTIIAGLPPTPFLANGFEMTVNPSRSIKLLKGSASLSQLSDIVIKSISRSCTKDWNCWILLYKLRGFKFKIFGRLLLSNSLLFLFTVFNVRWTELDFLRILLAAWKLFEDCLALLWTAPVTGPAELCSGLEENPLKMKYFSLHVCTSRSHQNYIYFPCSDDIH